jgi:hypothetical protein
MKYLKTFEELKPETYKKATKGIIDREKKNDGEREKKLQGGIYHLDEAKSELKQIISEDNKDKERKKLIDYVEGDLKCNTKKAGDDFEIHLDKKHIGQVIFRDSIKVKKVNNDKIGKFGFEGQYSDKSDFAKIKKEIKKIVDENK